MQTATIESPINFKNGISSGQNNNISLYNNIQYDHNEK